MDCGLGMGGGRAREKLENVNLSLKACCILACQAAISIPLSISSSANCHIGALFFIRGERRLHSFLSLYQGDKNLLLKLSSPGLARGNDDLLRWLLYENLNLTNTTCTLYNSSG